MKTKVITTILIALFLASVVTITMPVNAKDLKNVNVPHDFSTIQAAVDAVIPGGHIHVEPGTYQEQIEISKNVVIEGARQDKTIILSPDLLTKSFTSGINTNKPIIYVHDADDVTIKGLTVDGAGNGKGNYRFEGIAFHNAGGTVEKTTIIGMRETPPNGNQHGIGLYALVDNGNPQTLKVKDNDISDYQKNGMALNGVGLTVKVEHNTVTGLGKIDYIAQNGIQVGFGATGEVKDNKIADNWYTPATDAGTGILLLNVDNCKVDGNKIDSCLVGIYNIGNNNKIAGNKITNCFWDVL
jgi:parallel beta-helix repeat protein